DLDQFGLAALDRSCPARLRRRGRGDGQAAQRRGSRGAAARVLRAVLGRGARREGVRLVLSNRRARGPGPGRSRVISRLAAFGPRPAYFVAGVGTGVETPALQTNFPAVTLSALTRTELVPAVRPLGSCPDTFQFPLESDVPPSRVEVTTPVESRS